MSSFGRREREILERAREGKYVDEERKRRRRARLQKGLAGIKIADKKPKPKGHHEKRMESLQKQLETGVYDRPEFSASIPDESTTVAPMIRGGFQSPPTTPPRQKVPGLVRTTTPVIVPRAPKLQLKEKFQPRTRAGEKGHPNVTTRRRRKSKLQKEREMAERHAARAKRKVPQRPLEISDSDTDQGDEKVDEGLPDWWDPPMESDTSDSDAMIDWDPKKIGAMMRRRREARMRSAKEPKVRAIKRPTTNIAGLRALRAKEKKDRLAKKRQRVNIRHNVQTHHPFVPKLQINQKGPGQFMVRATGITGAVRNQVKSLLARVKGKLFVNGKFVNPKRAYNLIMKLLEQKQVISIQLK